MRLILLGALLLGLWACTSSPEQADTAAPAQETTPPGPAEDAAPPEPVVVLDTVAVAPLRPYIGDSLARATARYVQHFKQATTAEALAAVYTEVKALTTDINTTLDIPYEAVYGWMDSLNQILELPGLATSCVAECSEAVLAVRFPDFIEQAQQTPVDFDATFFTFIQNVYREEVAFIGGDPDAFPVWFEQSWDYGGSSLLGDSIHLDYLQQIEQLQQATDLFADDLQRIRTGLLDDIVGTERPCTTYMNTVPPIQAEIQAILGQITMTEAEQQRLTDRLAAFDDLAGHNIEVNCRESSCLCGQG